MKGENMRMSFGTMPYSNLCVGYIYGFFNDKGEPYITTIDSFIKIENNRIKWSFPDTVYDILDGITEFTLSPTFIIIYDGKSQIGANPYYPKPSNGTKYGLETAEIINAPFMEGLPIVIECRVTKRSKEKRLIGSYESIDYELEAEIVNVNIESSFIDQKGEVILPRLFGFIDFWKFGDDA